MHLNPPVPACLTNIIQVEGNRAGLPNILLFMCFTQSPFMSPSHRKRFAKGMHTVKIIKNTWAVFEGYGQKVYRDL
jgi:hypothetical protein